MRKFKFIVQHDIIVEATEIDEAAQRVARLNLGRTLGAEVDADEQTVVTGGRLIAFEPPTIARLEEL